MNPETFDVLDGLMHGMSRHLRLLRDEIAYVAAGGAEVDQTLTEVQQVHRLKRGSRRGLPDCSGSPDVR